MNGEQLVALLAQYEIGVSRRQHDLLEIDESGPPGRQIVYLNDFVKESLAQTVADDVCG